MSIKFIVGDTYIRVSLPMIILALIVALFGNAIVVYSLIALIPHELGHIWAAMMLKEDISEIELMPFGASIRLTKPTQNPLEEFAIAAAGPVFSIIGATLLAGVVYFFPSYAELLHKLIGASLFLGAFNCLPALPLDGGRMLRALLRTKLDHHTANVICSALGLAVALCCFAICALSFKDGRVNISMAMLGVFALAGTLSEYRNGSYVSATATIDRRSAFRKRGNLTVKTVAIYCETPAREALKAIKGASIIAVVDYDMRLVGSLAEGDLLRGMVEHGSEIEIGKLIEFDRGKRAW